MLTDKSKAYLAIAGSVLVWSTTSISTKILLRSLEPLQVMLIRFALGTLVLFLIWPKPLKEFGGKRELYYMMAGLTGVCMYFWMDHIALKYTTVTNVSVLTAITPVLTAAAAYFFLKEKELKGTFWIGALICLAGVVIYYLTGSSMKIHLLGDTIALASSFVWAVYSVFLTKISKFGLPLVQTTRRINLYGLGFMTILYLISGEKMNWSAVFEPISILNFIYLAAGASSLCFVAWSYALKIAGAGKTNVCSYFGVAVTIVFSAIILGERIGTAGILSAVMIMLGVVIAEQGDRIIRAF